MKALSNLRRRRGAFARHGAWLAEISRLRASLGPGTLEQRAFDALEVQGLTFKAAAINLGLSERHLYRIHASMERALSAVPRLHESAQPVEQPERDLEIARSLFMCGKAASALGLVARALESPASRDHAVALLALQSRLLNDLEEFDKGDATLEEAKRSVLGVDLPSSSLLSELSMSQAYSSYRRGLFGKAIDEAEKALIGQNVAAFSVPQARNRVRHLIFLGVMHQEGGSPHTALRHLESARRILSGLPEAPAAELAQISLHSAFARVAISGQVAHAIEDAREALRIAEWHGLVYETIWANLAMAMAQEVAGAPAAGLPHAYTALSLATDAFSGDPLARTLFLTSRVEAAVGLYDDALTRLRDAEPEAGQRGLLRGILYVCQARIERQAGRASRTIDASTRAINELEAKSTSHLIGIPYLSRAVARQKVGKTGSASDIEAAIAYLERGGSLKDVALAYEASFAITGNRAHREHARQLRSA